MLKSLTFVIDSWARPNFTLVRIVVLNFHQVKLDYIARCANQIWIKQVNFLNSKFISCNILNYSKWINGMLHF